MKTQKITKYSLIDDMPIVIFTDKNDPENECYLGDEFIVYRNSKEEHPGYYFPNAGRYVVVFSEWKHRGCLFYSANTLAEINKKFRLKKY